MGETIRGGAGSTLQGTSGDDRFELSGAPASLNGDAGFDTAFIAANLSFGSNSVSGIERFEVGAGIKTSFSALAAGYRIVAAPEIGSGAISVTGSTGADTLTGGAANDTLDGAQGNDVIDGGAGNDLLIGGPGSDTLRGGDGDDFIQVKRATGPDVIEGGAGNDRLSIDVFTRQEDLRLDISDSASVQRLGEGTTITGIEQITITGGVGDDRFTGGALADALNGGDGDDTLEGGAGNDTLTGGNGYDIAAYRGVASAYQITNLGNGSYRVVGAEGTDTLTGIETLRFADGDRPIGGYAGTDVYFGSPDGTARFVKGSDIPDGRGATPGTGFTITGLVRLADGTFWAANEGQADATDTTYTPSLVHIAADGVTKLGEIVLPSSVRAVQGLGVNEATGTLFYASLSERLIRIVNFSGAQTGTMSVASGAPNAVTYDKAANALVVGLSDGSPGNTVVQWRSLADGSVLKTLNVGVNPDHLFVDPDKGAAGTLYVSYGPAQATGYVAQFDVASGTLTGRFELPAADAIEGIVVNGSRLFAANDAYYHQGSPPENRILEFAIDQSVAFQLTRAGTTAGLSIDLARHDQTLTDGTRLVGVERLFFTGGDGADTVTGGVFNDVLVGNGGADKLSGGAGSDRLVGGAGNDTLQGGAGDDGLEGGAGSDTAVFSGAYADYRFEALSATSVRVTDLRAGADGVDIVADVERFAFRDGTFTLAELTLPPSALGTLVLDAGDIAENSAAGTRVGALSLSSGMTDVVYTLLTDAGGRFTIRDDTLVLGQTGLDYETAASHQITIRATETERGRSVDLTVDLPVQDRNDAPTDIVVSNLKTVSEASRTETRIGDVSVTDPDGDPAFRVNAVAVSDERFTVRDGGLFLKAGQTLRQAEEPTIALTLTTGEAGGTVTRSVTVSVDAAAVPTAIQLSASSIAENLAAGSTIGRLALVPGAVGNVSYALLADDGRFAIDGDRLVTARALDYELAATHSVALRATDAAGRTVEMTLDVAVEDRNDPVTGLTGSNFAAVARNSPLETRVADLSVDDADTNAAFRAVSWSVSDDRFLVRDGSLYLKLGQAPTGEPGSTLPVTVTVSDGLASRSLTVDIPLAGPSEGDDRGTLAVFGTGGSDTLSGLGGNDQIFGFSGNDTLDGGAGADELQGGDGVDSLIGGFGNDTLEGGTGADTLVGGDGSDAASYAGATLGVRAELLAPGTNTGAAQGDIYSGIENLIGSAFSDRLSGDNAANEIRGGKGGDTIYGQGGADKLYGEDGDDAIYGQGGADLIDGGAGNDTLSGGSGGPDTFVFSGGWGNDRITDYDAKLDILDFRTGGLALSQLTITQSGADALITGPNGETLRVLNTQVANLVVQAGSGSAPLLDISLSNATVREDGARGTVVGLLSATGSKASSLAYALVDDGGGRFAIDGDRLVATGTLLDYETTASHNVRIRVTDSDGVSAVETFTIGVLDANDAPTAITVSNQVAVPENKTTETRIADLSVVDPDTAAAFRNHVLSTDDARFEIHDAGLWLRAGNPLDFEAASSVSVVVTATDEAGSTSRTVTVAVQDVNEAAVTTFNGTNGADAITTNADVINGRKGDDTIFATSPYEVTVNAGEGSDRIEYQGAGRAIVHGDDQSDTIIGGAKGDQLWGDGGEDRIEGRGGDDTLNGGDSADTILGGEGNDVINGGTGNDTLHGGTGDDAISGGTEDDWMEGGDGADKLDGGAGYDTASYASATAGVRADLLSPSTNLGEAKGDTFISIEHILGSRFNDELLGTDGPNRLLGGDGDDILSGFGGTDQLQGGAGNDILNGQGGVDVLNGGLGDDTLSGGLNAGDQFVFEYTSAAGEPTRGWGADTIVDFERGLDHINLTGTGLTFARLSIVQQGSDALVLEGDYGSSILIKNVSAASLSASDFYF